MSNSWIRKPSGTDKATPPMARLERTVRDEKFSLADRFENPSRNAK